MRIAVIDDESMFSLQLGMIIKKLAAKKEIPLDLDSYSSGQDFIDSLSDRHYDIVFMDIFMPDMDGIATATKLREMTERIFLIFMTASGEHYPDAFSLHAFDYVTKPFTLERIEQVIDEIISHTPMDQAFVKISVGTQDIKIYLHDISSVTTDGHYINILKESGESFRARMTLNEFLTASGSDRRFLVVNRGIVVNMDYIKEYDSMGVTLTNCESYPVSTKKTASILQQINDYSFSKK